MKLKQLKESGMDIVDMVKSDSLYRRRFLITMSKAGIIGFLGPMVLKEIDWLSTYKKRD